MKTIVLLTIMLLASAACAQNPLPSAPQPAQASAVHAAPMTDEPIVPPTVVYPAEAQKARIQGTVVLEVKVSAAGEVTGVQALSGPAALRQAAVDAYLHAQYRPLMKDGRAIPADVTTSVNFALHELPPDTDQQLEKAFVPLHVRCQTASAENDASAVTACQDALDMANRFSPKFDTAIHATAYNDLALALVAAKRKPEAAQLAEDAVARFVDSNVTVTHHSPAAATAYITRAETRSLTGNARGAVADCLAAEEIIHTLLNDGSQDDVDKAANYRQQLRETMLLHAVVLDHLGKKADANRLRDEAKHI